MKRKRRTGLIIFSILVIIVVVRIGGIIHQRFDKTSTKTVRLGLVGTDSEPVWDNVRKRLKKQGINIEYVVFNDYVQPDVALKEGKIDILFGTHKLLNDKVSLNCFKTSSTPCL